MVSTPKLLPVITNKSAGISTLANDKRNKIETFLSSLKDKSQSIDEFDEELFNVMINKAVANRDESIEFIFNSGYKVKVETGE